MTKHYFTRVLLASLCVTSTLRTVSAADVAASANEVQIQRSFVNLSFNQPALSGTHAQLSESQVEGWLTTHKLPKLIEIWRGKGPDSSAPNSWGTSNLANQYAELNAEDASALYQSVCLFKNEEFT